MKISSVDKLRVRDGDEVIGIYPASTLEHIIFFSSDGVAYTLPVEQIPPSTGHGEPISKHIKLSDGASILCGMTTDPRFTPEDTEYDDFPPSPYLFIATAQGQVARMSLSSFRTASTKAGRKYHRLGKGDRVVHVEIMNDEDNVFLVSKQARLIHFNVEEVPVLANAGKGVRGLKLVDDGDYVLGVKRLSRPSDALKVINENGKSITYGQMKYNVTSRGGKGVKTSQRTGIESIQREDIEIVDWSEVE